MTLVPGADGLEDKRSERRPLAAEVDRHVDAFVRLDGRDRHRSRADLFVLALPVERLPDAVDRAGEGVDGGGIDVGPGRPFVEAAKVADDWKMAEGGAAISTERVTIAWRGRKKATMTATRPQPTMAIPATAAPCRSCSPAARSSRRLGAAAGDRVQALCPCRTIADKSGGRAAAGGCSHKKREAPKRLQFPFRRVLIQRDELVGRPFLEQGRPNCLTS